MTERRSARYPLYVARHFVRARHQRFLSLISLLSAASFFVGVLSLILAIGLMTGFQDDVTSRILDSDAQLLVAPRGVAAPIPAADLETLRLAIENAAGIEAAEPVVRGHAGIAGSAQLQVSLITGIDPLRAGRIVGVGTRMTSGRFEALAAPTPSGRPGIVLGQDLARKIGVVPGDVVRLYVLRGQGSGITGAVRQPSFEVVGLFATGYQPIDAAWSFIALTAAREAYGLGGGAHAVAARVRNRDALAAGTESVAHAAGGRYAVDGILARYRPFFAALRLEKVMMFVAIALIVVVAALGVISTLVITVTRKLREIGVLVSMGATPRGILQVFVLQGLAMGLTGTLAGAAMGVGASYVLDRFRLVRLDPAVYSLDHLPFTVRGGDLALVLAVSVAIALAATLYPAWRAARLDPVQALRGD